MALARERPPSGTHQGSSSGRGLTLFLVPVARDAEGRPQVGMGSRRLCLLVPALKQSRSAGQELELLPRHTPPHTPAPA